MDKKVVTRFAPSPTGKAHAGSYRTALYAWLYARKHKGTFILRIEDTDTARNSKEAEEDIYEALTWLGLSYDKKYIQSENNARHQEILELLIEKGDAYISEEEAKDGSGVIKKIVRFKNPNKLVTFTDEIRGEVSTDTSDLGDFVIARSISEPLYHLAVIVDDHDEEVTHVIRAEEHIANTPRQILLLEALGWEIPHYAHVPIVLGKDKQKLSKRKGALAMTEYAKKGYVRDAVFNCIAMVGWNPADPGSEQEIFTVDELITRFDFDRVQKSSAVFNEEKLDWFNRQYVKNLSSEEFWNYVLPFLKTSRWNFDTYKQTYHSLENILREKITVFADVEKMLSEGELDYFFESPIPLKEMLSWKGTQVADTKMYLEAVQNILEESSTAWNYDEIKTTVWPQTEKYGTGQVLWPFRVALSGKEKSSDPFEIASIIGKQETLSRIAAAIAVCE
jgi:nondiscriminating glutamyl-tRNA synthetase